MNISKKSLIAVAAMLLTSSSMSFAANQVSSNQPASYDAQRERIGLQTIETQLVKINELATSVQASANPNAKYHFDYAKFQNEIERIQHQVNDYLYRPLQPVPSNVLDKDGSQFQE
ncbi:TPA: RAQPRD family integrative conjugative element protein [Photobacterium damselae]